jgi:hypothetical protein
MKSTTMRASLRLDSKACAAQDTLLYSTDKQRR